MAKSVIVAHLKLTIVAQDRVSKQTVYRQLIAPSKEYMDFAIKNYVHKYGILEAKGITKEEYESNTQI